MIGIFEILIFRCRNASEMVPTKLWNYNISALLVVRTKNISLLNYNNVIQTIGIVEILIFRCGEVVKGSNQIEIWIPLHCKRYKRKPFTVLTEVQIISVFQILIFGGRAASKMVPHLFIFFFFIIIISCLAITSNNFLTSLLHHLKSKNQKRDQLTMQMCLLIIHSLFSKGDV